MRQMKDSGFPWIGVVPENWEVRKLKHYYKMQTGFTPDTKKQEFYDDEFGFDWVNISDLQDGATITETKKKISQLYVEQFNPDLIPQGSLMYSFKLSVGQTSYAGKPIYSNEAIASFLADDNVDLHYLRYSSIFIIENAQTNIYNAKILNQDLINNAYVPFPPLPEQQSISAYLDRQCSLIDSVIEKTKASIEEYKKLRQAVITQAVTKGVRGDRAMKDSGIEWIGEIPQEWEVYRMGALYSERKEQGNDELPILTVSINTGVSDRELADDETARIFVRSEDRSKYMRVYPGDLTYNMMRAWQGAFGAVRVDGMVSPAYVIAKPQREIDSRYMEALLRTPAAKEEMKRYSHGIADFRLRLYWEKFKYIRICFPPVEEQKEIADYIDKKCAEIDSLISKKEQFLTELDSYKKSLIYEYVTGKKEVPQA